MSTVSSHQVEVVGQGVATGSQQATIGSEPCHYRPTRGSEPMKCGKTLDSECQCSSGHQLSKKVASFRSQLSEKVDSSGENSLIQEMEALFTMFGREEVLKQARLLLSKTDAEIKEMYKEEANDGNVLEQIKEIDEVSDVEHDDLIPDLPDDEDDEDLDQFEKAWEAFENACSDHNTDTLTAFASHIYEINERLGSDLTALTSRLSVDEIHELTAKINAVAPPAPTPEAPAPPTPEAPAPTKPATAVIHLQKGYDQNKIKEFLIRIDSQLGEGKFEDVNVVTNDWASSSEPFPLITAAKKLFVKYVEAGLLGCLMTHGHHEAAKKVYCVAYVKGKARDGQIVFTGINSEDYQEKLIKSFQAYTTLVGSVKIQPVKKEPIEISK